MAPIRRRSAEHPPNSNQPSSRKRPAEHEVTKENPGSSHNSLTAFFASITAQKRSTSDHREKKFI
jgi:hypothetical protein